MWKKFYVALALLFLASLPLFSESVEVPSLEPEAVYEIQGKDLITLYTTINDLNETKNEWKNLTTEAMKTSEDVMTLCHEYEKENKKLQLQNNFLIGGVTVTVGVVVVGAILFTFTNIK